MRVTELRSGLWRWTGLHPDWTPEQGGPNGWAQEISCYYWEAPEAVFLVDPLIPPEDRERFLEALDRDVERAGLPVRIALTAKWHSRSAEELAARYAAAVWAFDRKTPPPEGLRAIDAQAFEEALLWLEPQRALVSCEVILGDAPEGGVRLAPESWLAEAGWNHERLREALRPLLELPVELLLPTHGEPVVEGARERLAALLR